MGRAALILGVSKQTNILRLRDIVKQIILALVLAIGFVLSSSRADAACTPVSGTGEAVDGLCTESPLGLCASGEFAGSIEGTYVGAFQSLIPAPTLEQPLRLALVINSTITTPAGTLYQTETGYLVLNDTIATATCVTGCLLSLTPDQCLAGCVASATYTKFIQYMTPYAGTGVYSSITDGLIVATGYGDPVTATSYVDYSGEICE